MCVCSIHMCTFVCRIIYVCVSLCVCRTRPWMASMSSSAFLAHFCQKSGSSREMSVRLPVATKLACRQRNTRSSAPDNHFFCTDADTHTFINIRRRCVQIDRQYIKIIRYFLGKNAVHLGKGRALALRLYGYSVGSSLEDLVNVFLTEFWAFILLFHQSAVRSLSQQVLNLLLGQLLDLETFLFHNKTFSLFRFYTNTVCTCYVILCVGYNVLWRKLVRDVALKVGVSKQVSDIIVWGSVQHMNWSSDAWCTSTKSSVRIMIMDVCVM